MHPLIEELLMHLPVITDGAWGTQLQARGLPVGACPDEWNLSNPDMVEDVARGYVEAGSRVILSNTFGANRILLKRHGLDDRAVEIARAGAAISRRAAGSRAKVFASIGPTGAILMMGEVDESDVFHAFREQAIALAEGGADALVVETMSEIEEACIAIRAARETGLPVAACMVYDSGPNSDRTMMGATPESAAEALVEAGADIIGANCGVGPSAMLPICRRLKAATNLPLWVKPNAGLPEMVDGKVVYHVAPAEFAETALELAKAGASFLGGCCGTSPAFIAALARFTSAR